MCSEIEAIQKQCLKKLPLIYQLLVSVELPHFLNVSRRQLRADIVPIGANPFRRTRNQVGAELWIAQIVCVHDDALCLGVQPFESIARKSSVLKTRPVTLLMRSNGNDLERRK